jgi:hypothetical protein
MSAFYSVIKFGLVLVVFVGLLGCMEETVTKSPASVKSVKSVKSAAIASTVATPIVATAEKTAKPGAAIKLVSDSMISIAANERVPTDIVLDAMESGGELTLEFYPTQGLSVVNTSIRQTIKLDAASPIKIPIVLMAPANGRYYLNMHISLHNGDAALARKLALIVQVGPVVDRAVSHQKITGENVIVLPAQETISSQ